MIIKNGKVFQEDGSYKVTDMVQSDMISQMQMLMG